MMKVIFKKLGMSLFVVMGLLACTVSNKKTESDVYNPIKGYTTYQLKNGVNILYVPDNKLPYLSISSLITRGSSSDPKGKSGISAAVMELVTKGTQKRNASELSEAIETLGADLDVSIDKDYSSLSLEGLSWQEDALFDVFSEMLLSPRFLSHELERYKQRTISQIQQRLDQASVLATEALEKKLYAGTPYQHREIGSIETVKSLSIQDLSRHYIQMMNPHSLWIVVVGKSSPDFIQKIEKRFGKIKSQAPMTTSEWTVPVLSGKKVLLVDRPDSAQAEIRVGHYGIQRTASDYMAANIANSILGQGFTSRLVDRIRDQLGLTYSISSSFEVKKNKGYFSIRTFTQNERVGQTVSETLSIYKNFYQSGITPRELKMTQDSMIAKLPMLLETPEKLAYNLMILRLFNVSDNYLIHYRENVRALDLKTVNQSIQKNFDPENLWIVILGRADVIEPQIREFSPIKVRYNELD